MSKHTYKVIENEGLQRCIELAKKFIMKDLNIRKDVPVHLIKEVNDPFDKMEHLINKYFLSKNSYFEPVGLKSNVPILGEFHAFKRAVFISVDQEPIEILKTLCHELKHCKDHELGRFGTFGEGYNEKLEENAVNYEKRGMNRLYKDFRYREYA